LTVLASQIVPQIDLSGFYENDADITLLMTMLSSLISVDVKDSRSVLQPIVEKEEIELIFESTHPYADSTDTYTEGMYG
jgi:hypothetical protein